MIQIQFLDNDIINALVPVFSMKPDRVYYLFDDEDITAKQRGYFSEAVKRRLPDTEQFYVKVDRYKFSDVSEELEKIIEDNKGSEIVYDITGGTEIMTACGMMMCSKHGGRAVYMKLSIGEIFDINKAEKVCEIEHLNIDDYLTAIGAKRMNTSHTVPDEKDFNRILNACEKVFDRENAWHALCAHLCSQVSAERFGIPNELKYNNRKYGVAGLINCFVQNEFLTRGNGFYSFSDERSKEYLTTYGIWLELFMYIKALDFFDCAYIGEIIDWDRMDSDDTVDNEIDVIAIKNSIPYFISCKMRKPIPYDLYEADYLAKRFGGKQAKGIIATTSDVEATEGNPSSLYNRFKKMHIKYITPQQFKNNDTQRVFKKIV